MRRSPVNLTMLFSLALLAFGAAQGGEASVLSKRGQAHLDMGMHHADKAKAELEAAAPELAAQQTEQADAEFEKALALWREALESQPKSIDLRVRAATALTQLRRYREAEKTLRDALAIDPANSMSFYHLGALFMHEKRYGEAEKHLRLALEHTPWYPNAHYLLGYMLEEEGKYAEAARMYVAERKVNPASANAAYRLQKLQMDGKFGRNWNQKVEWTASKFISIAITLLFGVSVLVYAKFKTNSGAESLLAGEDTGASHTIE